MKLTTGILGCALATGLVTIASSNAQAAVIGNDLYVPLKVKSTITYVEGNKYKKMSYSNKDLLAAAGEDFKGAQLAYEPWGDVYVIYKDGKDYYIDANLTSWEYAYIDLSDYIDTYVEKNNSWSYTEQGAISMYFYDYYEGGQDELDLYGNYAVKEGSKFKNNSSDYTYSFSYKAKNLTGEAYSWDGESYYDDKPATGSSSAGGKGKLVD